MEDGLVTYHGSKAWVGLTRWGMRMLGRWGGKKVVVKEDPS